MTGIVLAGGQGKRLVTQKALLEIGGRPMIEAVLHTLSAVADRVVISANDPQAYAGFGLPVVPDLLVGRGPLSGLHAGMRAVADGAYLLVGADRPFVNEQFLRLLADRLAGYEATVPLHDGHPNGTCAAYDAACVDRVEESLQLEDTSLRTLLRRLRALYLEPEDYAHCGPPELLLFNVNTPESLARARHLALRA